MGTSMTVNIGAYAVITNNEVVKVKGSYVCKNHPQVKSYDSGFCKQCGSKLVATEEFAKAGLYDLLEEDKFLDVLQEPNYMCDDNSNEIIVIGNMSNDGTRINKDLEYGGEQEIYDGMGVKCIENFNNYYSEVLAVLREKVSKVEIKFGILIWWS